MQYIRVFEKVILGWLKDVPHLPRSARRWLGTNMWIFAIVGSILFGIVVLSLIGTLFSSLSILGTPEMGYYASSNYIGFAIINAAVSLVFIAIMTFLTIASVRPLKEKQKAGWVLLYFSWIFWVLFTVVSSVLTLNIVSIIGNLVLGAVIAGVAMYFLFEIHGEFAHVEHSRGVKASTKANK